MTIAARADAAGPVAEEAQQLPDPVDAEAAGLDRVADEVALEEPVVEVDVALGDAAPAVARARDLAHAVEHQHRRGGQARREALGGIFDQVAVGESQQLLLVEGVPLSELPLLHAPPPKRSR